MKIRGSTALVTGAGRGLGRHFVEALLDRGATRVYATARRPGPSDFDAVVPLTLDVTDPDSVAVAAAVASDIDLLVNNAGISAFTRLVDSDLSAIRREMETNFFGALQVARAFAPGMVASGGGAILNVLSVLSWLSFEGAGGYAASKAAAWSMTNTIRLELREQGIEVTGLLMASTDTDMIADLDIPKNDPVDVVRQALDAVEAGEIEVIADADSRAVKAALAQHPSALYPGTSSPAHP